MKHALLLAVSLLSILFTGIARADTVQISEFDHQSQVTLDIGDTLLITLNANLSTGYAWNIAQNNNSLLRPVGRPTYQSDDPNRMGSSGTQTFRFRAVGSGGEGLKMLYQKASLGGGVQAADTFGILVVINRQNRSKIVTITDINNHSQVQLNVGDTLVVRLTSNQTTGYTWRIGDVNGGVLRQAGSSYIKSRNGMMGSGGIQEFRFVAAGTGSTFLGLLYQRPFESGGIPAAERFEVQVSVSGGGGNSGRLLGSGG